MQWSSLHVIINYYYDDKCILQFPLPAVNVEFYFFYSGSVTGERLVLKLYSALTCSNWQHIIQSLCMVQVE